MAEAMGNKRYDEAAEGLAQMNRLTCIDNIVVDRLLEGARNEVIRNINIQPPRLLPRSCSHAPFAH